MIVLSISFVVYSYIEGVQKGLDALMFLSGRNLRPDIGMYYILAVTFSMMWMKKVLLFVFITIMMVVILINGSIEDTGI